MRVLNDREENTQPSELGVFAIATQAILVALGMGTLVFGPLPMLLGQLRLSEPWPKATALAGAVLALLILEVPPAVVVFTFVVGLFVADGLAREMAPWKLLGGVALIAAIAGIATVGVMAQLNHMTLAAFWSQSVGAAVGQLKEMIRIDEPLQWEMMRGVLLYEGPFLYLSFAILSAWASIGIAAHLEWLPAGHRFSGSGLRSLRVPKWASLAFIALFGLTLVGAPQMRHVTSGVFRLAGSLMFVQGCVCLSEMMARKSLRPRVRTLVYSMAVLLGFYALMGMGVLSPWFLRTKEKLEEVV